MVRLRHQADRATCAAVLATCLAVMLPAVHALAQSSFLPAGPPRPDPLRPPVTRPPAYNMPRENQTLPAMVAEVRITGNRTTSTAKVRSYLKTRSGRAFDPEVVQSDVRQLIARGLFRDVRTYTEATPAGTVVTFEVFERPTIEFVEFLGNRGVRQKLLLKEADLKVGDPLNYYAVDEARRNLERFYKGRGYRRAQVTVVEGTNPQDRGVVFRIHEGPLARVGYVSFVGNTIASDGRLKTQIKSKPGFFYVFGGEVEHNKIDEDLQRLTAYYRSLGYFQAKVGRELSFSSSGKWLSIKFVINEGPRYRIRNISFMGNERFDDQELSELTGLIKGQFFNTGQMGSDLKSLRDLYGSHGYVYADIQADPRFLENPGLLDLVFNIREGEQYRVGEIMVEIQGDNPHTRQSVVLNRRGNLQPGDVIDVRAVRDWEMRLSRSQLFAHEPQQGIKPQIKIVPPEWEEPVPATAERPSRGTRRLPPTVRGQNPTPGWTLFGPSTVEERTRSWPW
jgi:outer membrane protein insertion porin family